jgi:hypothetical protein
MKTERQFLDTILDTLLNYIKQPEKNISELVGLYNCIEQRQDDITEYSK